MLSEHLVIYVMELPFLKIILKVLTHPFAIFETFNKCIISLSAAKLCALCVWCVWGVCVCVVCVWCGWVWVHVCVCVCVCGGGCEG